MAIDPDPRSNASVKLTNGTDPDSKATTKTTIKSDPERNTTAKSTKGYKPGSIPRTTGPDISCTDLESLLRRSINPDVWTDVHDNFDTHESEFSGKYLHGHPHLLLCASDDIEGIMYDMEEKGEWQAFRNSIQILVSKTRDVKVVICLALGKYQRVVKTVKGIWVTQYAAFAYICRAIDQKQRLEHERENRAYIPIKRCFQEPQFDVRTEYLLTKIERTLDPGENNIMEHPEATELIDGDAFLYGIHIVPSMWKYILKKDKRGHHQFPQVMVTNTVSEKLGGHDRDSAVAYQYHRDCVLAEPAKASKKILELEAGFDKLSETHEELPFPRVSQVPNVDSCVFQRTSIFQQILRTGSQLAEMPH